MVRQISSFPLGTDAAEHPLRDVNTPTKYAKEPEPAEHPLRDVNTPTKYAKEPEPPEHPLRDKSGPTKYAKEPEPAEHPLRDRGTEESVTKDVPTASRIQELEVETLLAQDSRRFAEAAIKEVMDFVVELVDRYVPNQQEKERGSLVASLVEAFGSELYAVNIRLTESTYKLAYLKSLTGEKR